MYSKEVEERILLETVKKVTGIEMIEKSSSLLDSALPLMPASVIYIFDILEDELHLPVHEILVDNTFEVMTFGKLVDALFALEMCKQADAVLLAPT